MDKELAQQIEDYIRVILRLKVFQEKKLAAFQIFEKLPSEFQDFFKAQDGVGTRPLFSFLRDKGFLWDESNAQWKVP